MDFSVQRAALKAPWFSPNAKPEDLRAAGFKLSGGGGHQSKTMMTAELTLLLDEAKRGGMLDAIAAAETVNLFGKASLAASISALANLNLMYHLKAPSALTAAMIALWDSDPAARPLLTLLAALAGDPLFRDSAEIVVGTPIGDSVHWPALAEVLERKHPGRFSPATLRSLAQNCLASWTQSGHLVGKLRKVRSKVSAAPETAAYAALLSLKAGFGGASVLETPWFEVLDLAGEEQLSALRRAQGRGLVRMRQAGAVFELQVSTQLADARA